jgi:hypothetical protein
MAFLLFSKKRQGESLFYSNTGNSYKLAGYNLIYRLWEKRGRPVEQGWSVTADEILRQLNPEFSENTHSLVIDFDPKSTSKIGLIEIERIHIFTYGHASQADWSILMLEMRDVYYEEDCELAAPEMKAKCLQQLKIQKDRKKIFEFLYFQGNWCFGRNGSTNAGFIHDEARHFFLPFFTAKN